MTEPDRKDSPQGQESSVLKNKDEFLHSQHKGRDAPSHRLEELGERKDPAQRTDKRQPDSLQAAESKGED